MIVSIITLLSVTLTLVVTDQDGEDAYDQLARLRSPGRVKSSYIHPESRRCHFASRYLF